MGKPSDTQLDVLRRLVADGGVIERRPGGFWATPETAHGHHVPQGRYYKAHDVPAWWASTQTIRAMEKHGWLVRTSRHAEAWEDDRKITAEGIEALRQAAR